MADDALASRAARADALHAFFAPRSVAVIGASADKTKISGRLLNYLRRNNYPGELCPVNPNGREIDGLPIAVMLS